MTPVHTTTVFVGEVSKDRNLGYLAACWGCEWRGTPTMDARRAVQEGQAHSEQNGGSKAPP